MRQRIVAVGIPVAWAAAYALAMYAGRITRVGDPGLSLVWPAAGVGTVWFLSSHGRVRTLVAVTACAVVGVVVGRATSPDLTEALTIAAVVTVHPVAAVLTLRLFRWRTARPPQTLVEIPILLASSAAGGIATGAVAVAIAHLRFGGMWWEGAWQLSTRNTVSGFVATVVLLALPRLGERVGPARGPERVLLVVGTLAGTVGVMSLQLPLLYLLVPLTVMVAMRCGPYLTSGLVGVQGVLVVVETMRATGPLVDLLSPQVRILLAQLLIMVLAVLALVIAQEEQERAEALQRRREDRDRLRDHIDAALVANAQVVVRPGAAFAATSVNPALAALCRSTPEELAGENPLAWFRADDRDVVSTALEDLNRGSILAWRGQLRMAPAYGGSWVDAALSPIRSRDPDSTETAVNLQLLDITARKRAEDRLEALALHDQLTGLPNRALADDRIDTALAHAVRTGIALAVLYVDIDHFKQINDRRGHDGGDVLLCGVAARLAAAVRPHDTVARIGGDEFVVVCPAVGDREQADEIARRVLRAVSDPVLVEGEAIVVTASIGVAMADGRDGDAREVLRRADAALYAAKDDGRARIEHFSTEAHAGAERSVRLLDELLLGFTHDELVMEYQPIVRLASRRAVGLEALVRWRHPDRGMLMPRDFLDVVESSDLVFRLGDLAIRQACRDGVALLRAGHELSMHVNVSARQLERPGVADLVRAELVVSGFPPGLLALEITETRLLHVNRSLLRELAELRELGVQIAVDDFGTGYSGPAHLVQMPVDLLKLDRSFVAGIEDQRSAQAVSSGVLAMARGLGVGLIAEGIETAAQEAALLALGYELGQGFLYGGAMPTAQVGDWLHANVA